MKALRPIQITTDLAAICLAWVLSYYLRFHMGLDTPRGIPEPILYFKLLPFIGIIWFGVFAVTGFYRRSYNHRSAVIEGLDIIQGCAVAMVAFISFTYFYEEYRYSRLTTAIFAVLHPVMLITSRSLLRKALRLRLRHGTALKTLIVGTDSHIHHAYKLCALRRYDHTKVAGVVALDQLSSQTTAFLNQHDIPVHQEPSSWVNFLAQMDIAQVFIAVNQDHLGFIRDRLEVIAEQVPNVKVLPDFGRFSQLGMGIEMVGGMPVINVHDSPLQGGGAMLKRLMDVMCSALLLALLAPLMLLIAIAVKRSSPGPVFYRQKRMGMDGKRFDCLKFRTMPVNAEAQTGAVWATEEDNRATRVGGFLRRTSLDELPQLWNVLIGDMSLVGPRPERPVFVNKFRHNVPGYMLRHKVKAGITGWAQVNGWRGNTSIEKRIECDLFYVQNWSLWLDIKILVMTIDEVITGRNAY